MRNHLISRLFLITFIVFGQSWLTASPVFANPRTQTSAINLPATYNTPIRLKMEKISLDATVEAVGQTKRSEMDVPKDADNVAWYNLGVKPGEQGNAVISGHLDDRAGKAVFWQLRKLKVGDQVAVVDSAGVERTFAVIEVGIYPYNKAPLNKIFGFDLERDLNLITCTGKWNKKLHTYNQRLVVYTRLVSEVSQTVDQSLNNY